MLARGRGPHKNRGRRRGPKTCGPMTSSTIAARSTTGRSCSGPIPARQRKRSTKCRMRSSPHGLPPRNRRPKGERGDEFLRSGRSHFTSQRASSNYPMSGSRSRTRRCEGCSEKSLSRRPSGPIAPLDRRTVRPGRVTNPARGQRGSPGTWVSEQLKAPFVLPSGQVSRLALTTRNDPAGQPPKHPQATADGAEALSSLTPRVTGMHWKRVAPGQAVGAGIATAVVGGGGNETAAVSEARSVEHAATQSKQKIVPRRTGRPYILSTPMSAVDVGRAPHRGRHPDFPVARC